MKDYKQLATELRRTVLKMTHAAQSSHIGSNLGSADIMTVLYEVADFSKDTVLFKSWNVANAYACLVRKGLLPQEAIDEYGTGKWTTIAEPIPPYIPFGIGSMGMNLPAAVGFALAKKLKGEEGKVYCIISDGELDIGSTWESSLIAAHHELDNLIVIVDNNGFQAMGKTADILEAYFPAKGWDWAEIDGHAFIGSSSLKALENIDWWTEQSRRKPKVIIANTIKGKGVSFMENNNLYHYKQLSDDEYERAKSELHPMENKEDNEKESLKEEEKEQESLIDNRPIIDPLQAAITGDITNFDGNPFTKF